MGSGRYRSEVSRVRQPPERRPRRCAGAGLVGSGCLGVVRAL